MMRGDGEVRSRGNSTRLGQFVWMVAALTGFIILMRISALTQSTWALGALLFGVGAMAVLWNHVFRSNAYREFFAQRSGAKWLSFALLVLFGAGALALCALASREALRLAFMACLVIVQLLSVPLVERADHFSRKARTVILMVLHLVLDGVMLLLAGSVAQRTAGRGCFVAYAVSGAALFACRNLQEPAEPVLAAEEKLPASFSLWLQTVSADVIAAVFCGIAFTAEVSLRVGTPAAVALLLLSAVAAVLIGTRLVHSDMEYAVEQRCGLGCWLAAAVLCAVWRGSVALAVLILPLFGLGCALIVCGLFAMKKSFDMLLSDRIDGEKEAGTDGYLSASVKEALLLTGLMLLASLSVAICFLPHSSRIVTPALTMFSLAIGAVFLVRCWCLTTRQPLDRAGSEKIRRYLSLSSPEENPRLAERIRTVYVEPYTRSAGFWVVKSIVRPFFPSRFIGAENIDAHSDAPMIFVCNHLEIYGPIITQLHLPYPVRTWIINNMVDLSLTEQNLSGAIDKIFRMFSLKTRRWLCHVLARPVCWAMNCIDHVTVYRGSSRDVIRTIRDTVEAIECGDNILLFPENTSAEGENGAYKIGEVSAFFSGFSNIASSVYEKTGQCVTFYPLFADKKKKKIYAEKGITFDPSGSKPEEKKRIVSYLHDTMCEMAENAKRN